MIVIPKRITAGPAEVVVIERREGNTVTTRGQIPHIDVRCECPYDVCDCPCPECQEESMRRLMEHVGN